jgi:hypothetical protein
MPPSSSLSPLPSPTPHVYKLTLPPPSSIAATSPNPSEDTEAKLNSHRAQEEANISGINDADAIAKSQVQVPNNTLNNPNSDSTSKTACDDSECTGNSDLSHHLGHHPCDSRDLNSGICDDCKFVHDLGRNAFNTEEDSTDITSTSSDDVPYATHHSFACDHDKSFLTTSDVDHLLPFEFVQVSRPIAAPLTAQCALAPQHLAQHLELFSTTSILSCTSPAPHSNTSSIAKAVQAAYPTADATPSRSSIHIPSIPYADPRYANTALRAPTPQHRVHSPNFGSDTITSKCTDTLNNNNGHCNANEADNSSNSSSNEPISIAIDITARVPSINNSDFGVDTIISEEPDAPNILDNGNSNSNDSSTLDNSRCDTDTSDASSTNNLPVRIIRITAAHDDKPDHEHVHISSLDASHQVPPITTPQMDKPEEPPPASLTDTSRAAPNSQVVQDHHRLFLPDLMHAPPDSFDDPFACLMSRPRCLISPADDFSDEFLLIGWFLE